MIVADDGHNLDSFRVGAIGVKCCLRLGSTERWIVRPIVPTVWRSRERRDRQAGAVYRLILGSHLAMDPARRHMPVVGRNVSAR
jgi:hypothetical protein